MKLKNELYRHKLKGLNEYFNDIIIHATNEIEYFIKIYDIMIYSLDNLKNYESINNVNNFKAKKMIKEIEIFLKENLNNKCKYLINKYNLEDENIVYKINGNDSEIKIFGEEFVKNNKDICYLLFNIDIIELQENVKTNEKKI